MTTPGGESEVDRILAAQALEAAKARAQLAARAAAGIGERVAACPPYQAAVVMALALRRTLAIADLPKAEADFDQYGKLIDAGKRMNLSYLMSVPATNVSTEVSARLEQAIGTPELPLEDPGGSEGAFLGVAVMIEYLLDAWTRPDPEKAAEALDYVYSPFAEGLEDFPFLPPGAPLGEMETACQSADLDAVTSLGEPITVEQFDELAAAPESVALGQAYRARVVEIIAAGE